MIPKELIEEFDKIVATGDEKKAREFVIANLKKFPQETQDAIITALVQEALEKKNREDATAADFQKEILEAFKATGDAVTELEKHAKLAEIRENIQK